MKRNELNIQMPTSIQVPGQESRSFKARGSESDANEEEQESRETESICR